MELCYEILLRNYITGLYYGIAVQTYNTALYYRIILQGHSMESYSRQNHVKKLYYGVILQNHPYEKDPVDARAGPGAHMGHPGPPQAHPWESPERP